MLYSAFPHLFPLGKGLRKTGSVPQKDVQHILYQWHGKFAGCIRLVFLLFDQFQRHATARQVHATVKSNKSSLDAFSNLIAETGFRERLERAKNDPDAPESKALLSKLTPHINIINRKVPYTTAERSAALGHLLNMVRYYGPPSIFYTLAQDDIHGLLNSRMALPMTDNWSFPATESGFAEALRQRQNEFHTIPVNDSALRTLLARSPVPAGDMFRLVINTVFTHLLGTPPDNASKKKTVPLPNRKPGVFGTPIASFGVTEEQARGSLHMHLLFWGGLTPTVLQAIGGIPALVNEVASALDRIVKAQLQPLLHVRHIMKDLKEETVAHAALFKPTIPTDMESNQRFVQDYQRVVDQSNIHQHAPTCFKTKTGKRRCRLGRPVQLQTQTGCVQIVAAKTQPDTKEVTPLPANKPGPKTVTEKMRFSSMETTFRELPAIEPPNEAATTRRNFSRIPVRVRDTRLVMYYLNRPPIPPVKPTTKSATTLNPTLQTQKPPSPTPSNTTLTLPAEDQAQFDALDPPQQDKLNRALIGRNGLVVEYSPVASAVLGCNTNASVLGSDAQSKAALCYLLKYVTKPPAELAHSLSLLYNARKIVEEYPSRAEDSGTVIRTGMHYLNKVINKLSGAIEISAPMAAAAILGMPAETCSDTFWVAYVTAAVKYVKDHEEAFKPHPDTEFDDIDQEMEPPTTSNTEPTQEKEDDYQIIDENIDPEEGVHDDPDAILLDNYFDEKEPIVFGPVEEQRHTETGDETVVSTATIYVSQKKIVAVPQHIHYSFRGPKLANFSLYEYVALIDVVPLPPKKKTKSATEKDPQLFDQGGRETNATFSFQESHPLHGKINPHRHT